MNLYIKECSKNYSMGAHRVFVTAAWPSARWFPIPGTRFGPLVPLWAADLVVKVMVTSDLLPCYAKEVGVVR